MIKVRTVCASGVELKQGSKRAAAVDLIAMIDQKLWLGPQAPSVLIPTGVFIDMSDDPSLCAFVIPRSGLGHKGLVIGNGIGLIDNDYQGELKVSAWNRNPASYGSPILINPGDRIAQLMFLRAATLDVEFEEVDGVDMFQSSERGAGGFGSTGV